MSGKVVIECETCGKEEILPLIAWWSNAWTYLPDGWVFKDDEEWHYCPDCRQSKVGE